MVADTEGQVSASTQTGGPQSVLSAVSQNKPIAYVFAVIEDTAVNAFVDTGLEISLISIN